MYDAIVIGVGGMGSATVYQLARDGCRVLGLEQFGTPHAFGSSHGSTRIIRLAYSEEPEYVPLLHAANGATHRMAACMFTNTPDTDFILDRYGDADDVFVAAGFSGHGFKFCSVVGRIMADFCLDRPPRWEIGRFRLTPERV